MGNKLKKAVLKLLAKEIDEVRIQQIREYFQALDRDKCGFLTREDLLQGMHKVWGLNSLTAQDVSAVLPDAVGDRIAYNDFIAAMIGHHSHALGRAELLDAFRRFDVRKEGTITLESLEEVLKNAGPQSRLEILRDADVGRDGRIDFEEFCALIQACMAVWRLLLSFC